MTDDPYLVVGTGRSGTSTVARILHTKLGVFMGHEFPPLNESNPDGFYEDIDFYNANIAFVTGNINLKGWLQWVRQTILERQRLKKPWGFKEARMASVLPLYLTFFEEPRVIWCVRDRNLVIKSMDKYYGWGKRGEGIHDSRINAIGRILKGRDGLVIDFGARENIPDKEIIGWLRKKWKDL